MKGKKLTKKKEELAKVTFLLAMEKHHGIVSPAVRYLQINNKEYNICWSYYLKKWRNYDDEFKIKYELAKVGAIENIEYLMWEKAAQGDTTLMRFITERKGGYVEETKTDISFNTPIKINIINPSTPNKK